MANVRWKNLKKKKQNIEYILLPIGEKETNIYATPKWSKQVLEWLLINLEYIEIFLGIIKYCVSSLNSFGSMRRKNLINFLKIKVRVQVWELL